MVLFFNYNINMLEIEKEIINILERLEDKGYEAYIVGGAVRDLLLNKKILDIDINTNASNKAIKMIFNDYPLYDIGKELGTVTLVLEKYKIDITPFRKEDRYVNHRRPSIITNTNDLKEDLIRRDFTINAICINSKKEIVDLLNGVNDLNNKIIKAIGNPYNRFEEDALRILRAIRFKSILDFKIEEETNKALFELKDLLNYISNERKKEEFLKTLSGRNVQNIINDYLDIFNTFINIKAIDEKIDNFCNPFYRLAYLIQDSSELKKLTFSKHEIHFLESLLYAKNINIDDDYEFIKCLSDDNYSNEILEFLSQLNEKDLTQKYRNIKKYCVTINSLDINGNELIEFGYKNEETKKVKNHLVDKIHHQELDNENASLKRYLKNAILKIWN